MAPPLNIFYDGIFHPAMCLRGLQNGDPFQNFDGVTFHYPMTFQNSESYDTKDGALKQGVMLFVYAGTP